MPSRNWWPRSAPPSSARRTAFRSRTCAIRSTSTTGCRSSRAITKRSSPPRPRPNTLPTLSSTRPVLSLPWKKRCRRPPERRKKPHNANGCSDLDGRAAVFCCGLMEQPLRLVAFTDPETSIDYRFVTNAHHLKAGEIAEIYKERWKIELFFKWIKQNLKIKTFLGTSANAVLTQVWIALCVYLLLAYLRFKAKLRSSMQQILRVLQLNLFARRNLIELFKPPPVQPTVFPRFQCGTTCEAAMNISLISLLSLYSFAIVSIKLSIFILPPPPKFKVLIASTH